MSLFSMLWSFTKIGLLSFGGGSAIAPLVFKEFVERKKVISEEEFVEYLVISNTLPGPIMVKMATAIGYKEKGVLGAFLSSIAITLPMMLIFTILITTLFTNFDQDVLLKIVTPVLVCIAAVMLSLSKRFFDESKKDIKFTLTIILLGISFSLIYFLNVHPASIVFVMAVLVFIKVVGVKK